VATFTAGAGTQTLPIWISANYARPNQLPLVNVAAVFVLLLSIDPVYLSARLTRDPTAIGRT
jgi:putative spermidine/putrescine transport system permease protein